MLFLQYLLALQGDKRARATRANQPKSQHPNYKTKLSLLLLSSMSWFLLNTWSFAARTQVNTPVALSPKTETQVKPSSSPSPKTTTPKSDNKSTLKTQPTAKPVSIPVTPKYDNKSTLKTQPTAKPASKPTTPKSDNKSTPKTQLTTPVSKPAIPKTQPNTTPASIPATPKLQVQPTNTEKSGSGFISKTALKNPTNIITIKAVGDIVPGTNFPDNRLPSQKKMLFKYVKPYLQGADILFGNFESTLTNYAQCGKDTSHQMVFAFRTPPDYAELLKSTGFNILSVANNHSLDFSDVGFADTMRNIQNVGIKPVGKKNQIVYLKIKNIPVAFIGFSFLDAHNSLNDLTGAKALVAQAKKKAKIVVVSVHAGAEGTDATRVKNQHEMFYGEDRGNELLFAHTVIDNGADLVLGHGPHVNRAVELYKNKLIAYSLGNFVGYRALSTEGVLGKSLILQVKLTTKGDFISGQIIPVFLDQEGIPHPDKQFSSVHLISNLTKSDFPNTSLSINNNGQISKIFRTHRFFTLDFGAIGLTHKP